MLSVVAEVLSAQENISDLDLNDISEEKLLKIDELYETHQNLQLVPVPPKNHTPDDDSLAGDENGIHIRSVSSVLSEPNGK